MGNRRGSVIGAMLLLFGACGGTSGPPDEGPPRDSLDAGPLDVRPPDDGPADAGDQGPNACENDRDCRDDDACTRDACGADGFCTFMLQDLDGDGYAPISCEGGLDCDDDPLTGADVNPDAEEICDDGIDNNCDGVADAFDAVACPPDNDDCSAARELTPGVHDFGTAGLRDAYDLGCDPDVAHVDAVFRFSLRGHWVVRIAVPGALAIEVRRSDECTSIDGALGCNADELPDEPGLLRLDMTRHFLGPGTYDLIVSMPVEPQVASIDLGFNTIGILPNTDVCGVFRLPVIDESAELSGPFAVHTDAYPSLACGSLDAGVRSEDAFWILRLDETSDVTITATGETDGEPSNMRYALVADCDDLNGTALGCAATDDGAENPLVLEAVPPGDYWVMLEGDEEHEVSRYTLDVTIEPTP